MKQQSDGINDDWARRFSELRLGRDSTSNRPSCPPS